MSQLLMILLVSSFSAHARVSCGNINDEPRETGRWVQDSERYIEYHSPHELSQFLERHIESLQVTKVSDIEYATERLMTYHWEGWSSCRAGDPRLRLEYDGGEVKFKGDGAPITSLPLSEFSSDPCEPACGGTGKQFQAL